MTAYDAAYVYAGTPKVHCVGFSMGGGGILRWAGLNPGLVASLTLLMPMVSIDDIYQDNDAGLRAAIQTAWGVVHPAALPAAAHPLTQYAPAIVAAGIPVRMFYSDADAYIELADIAAMDAALGSNDVTTEWDPDNSGHTEATIADMGAYGDGDWQWLVDFMVENMG
jgi:pimeloyl-ACP methyl ester carboxylesterase